jgi:hypothetical protein
MVGTGGTGEIVGGAGDGDLAGAVMVGGWPVGDGDERETVETVGGTPGLVAVGTMTTSDATGYGVAVEDSARGRLPPNNRSPNSNSAARVTMISPRKATTPIKIATAGDDRPDRGRGAAIGG